MTKVLIVDDKENNLFALEHVLRPLNVAVIQALTGEDALRATLNHDFALAILDVQMPNMDGYELATLLRADGTSREIPIIFLSAAYSAEPHVFRGYASGAVDYITKPFNAEILLSKVKIFLELHERKCELAVQKDRLEILVGQLEEQIEGRRQAEECLLQTNETLEQKVNERTSELAEMVEALRIANEQLAERATQLTALTGRLTMAEHHERGRVSKILHDGLQQHLAVAKLRLAMFAEQLGTEKLKQAAGEIDNLIGESIQIARSLSAELYPPVLHTGDLADGLRWLTSWMHDKHAFNIDLDIQGSSELPDDVKILAFESVRELLFNAVKHANVSRAQLDLRQVDGASLCIRVSDKGVGFEPNRLKPAGGPCTGMGLFSISERIALIGGRLHIDSFPGKGCRFTLTVPLKPGSAGRMGTHFRSVPTGASENDKILKA